MQRKVMMDLGHTHKALHIFFKDWRRWKESEREIRGEGQFTDRFQDWDWLLNPENPRLLKELCGDE